MTLFAQPQPPRLLPEPFIRKWMGVQFGEKQAAQEMFLDLCHLVGHPTPGEYGNPEAFTFEKWVPGGFADAYLEERFGWEFKGSDADLDAAMQQLLRYQVHLKTPPLLIVSSFRSIRIQTNFPGMVTTRHDLALPDLAQPEKLQLLRSAFFAPADLRPDRSVEEVTRETADLFRDIVADMEQRNEDPERLARYLNQLVFCLYAEDTGLLPDQLFTDLVSREYRDPASFNRAMGDLFARMAGGGMFGAAEIPWFNGDLFNAADTVELSPTALQRLGEAARKNWSSIEPSIFGTLFERALDASKRSQLGAHYTGAEDIMLVVEPVVLAPLRREWETARQEMGEWLAEGAADQARQRLAAYRERLAAVKVLDPACGSGNFLYIALRALLDLERQAIDFAAMQGWDDLTPQVQPNQMQGLEINSYAAELARTALWIGYIQWHQANGFPYVQQPILTPLDTVRQSDAILDLTDPAKPREPQWPAAEFIIGNPPFLGSKMMRKELGSQTVDALHSVYGKRLGKGSDLCCYWFEKAGAQIAAGKSERAGLLGTTGIRFSSNRAVLRRIKEAGNIFMAYQDREWPLDGAMVHIAIVGFDNGKETTRSFNGEHIQNEINFDLTHLVDLTRSQPIKENAGIAFQGFNRVGEFDISEADALTMLGSANPDGRLNSDVVKPYRNADDLLGHRNPSGYTIDFGIDMPMSEAALYVLPFERVREQVKPVRENSNSKRGRDKWWLYQLPSVKLRAALSGLNRYLVTGRVSKHRIFVWQDGRIMPDNALVVFAKDDDYIFGVLQSRFHELWTRAKGSQLRDAVSGFRYTPSTCFEMFPFPEPTEEQRETIAARARKLNELREGYLHPPGVPAEDLVNRTLTELYNKNETWLQLSHQALDTAVAAAYGWPADLSDQEILGRLLALNLARAGG